MVILAFLVTSFTPHFGSKDNFVKDFSISAVYDSFRGIVVCQDKVGAVLFKLNQTIVVSGSQFDFSASSEEGVQITVAKCSLFFSFGRVAAYTLVHMSVPGGVCKKNVVCKCAEVETLQLKTYRLKLKRKLRLVGPLMLRQWRLFNQWFASRGERVSRSISAMSVEEFKSERTLNSMYLYPTSLD